jgi:teichuronic acid biosynthesis glycosyltransferase TuaC
VRSRWAVLVMRQDPQLTPLSSAPGIVGFPQPPPVRLLTLTTLFPNSRQPRHGIFVANRLRMLCATGRVDATVIAALPRFPGHYRETTLVPRVESIAGLDVYHPRYFHWPGVGMRRQPDSLARALLAELRKPELVGQRFDVVDAHYFYPDGVAAELVAEALGLPLVISARGSDINLLADIPFARRGILRAAARAQAIVAVSEALKTKMVALGVAGERIRVLRNGVDMDMFTPVARSEARKRLQLEGSGPLVVAVGNLLPEKGLDLLIRAVGADASLRLLIVGEGYLRDSLRSLADRKAPGRVAFRDNMPQTDLCLVYSAGNALALPSLREGWPNVLLEAIACGTPVVASAVGGVAEIIQDGAPGVLVKERTIKAWSDGLTKVQHAFPAPERVRAYATAFGWAPVLAHQCALYESVSQRIGISITRV